jgi:hypothetical protein
MACGCTTLGVYRVELLLSPWRSVPQNADRNTRHTLAGTGRQLARVAGVSDCDIRGHACPMGSNSRIGTGWMMAVGSARPISPGLVQDHPLHGRPPAFADVVTRPIETALPPGARPAQRRQIVPPNSYVPFCRGGSKFQGVKLWSFVGYSEC